MSKCDGKCPCDDGVVCSKCGKRLCEADNDTKKVKGHYNTPRGLLCVECFKRK